MIKLKLNNDHETIKTYPSKRTVETAVSFHRLTIHDYEIFQTTEGRFTALFKPIVKDHYIREKGFLLYEDIFG